MTQGAEIECLIHIRSHDSIQSIINQVEHAEQLGFKRVSMGEATGWNRVPILTLLADRTKEIGITNDVFSPYSRSPALLGQTASVLQRVSDGRYRLGLGTSSPPVVENWHGIKFDRPLRRLRETIEIVRKVTDGGSVEYEGQIFELGGLSFEDPVPETTPPIDVAAIGPKTVELTGRFADGWIPQLFTPDGLRTRLSDLGRGLDLGNRDSESVRTSIILRCCAMDNGDRAREIARKQISFIIGAYGPYYRKSLARQGFEETTKTLRQAWQEGEHKRMPSLVPDELLDDLVAAGTPEEVRRTYDRFASLDGVNAVRVGFFDDQPLENQRKTIETLADK